MEKFRKLFGLTYYFTEDRKEIPPIVWDNFAKAIFIDYDSEEFVCATWIENFASKGRFFVLVTNKRVVMKDPKRLEQNSFYDVTGIEQDSHKNLVLLSAGNTSKLFHVKAIPHKKLINKLMTILNKLWLNNKNSNAEKAKQNNPTAIEQIEQLAKLKDSGILTETEFNEKKAELLKRI